MVPPAVTVMSVPAFSVRVPLCAVKEMFVPAVSVRTVCDARRVVFTLPAVTRFPSASMAAVGFKPLFAAPCLLARNWMVPLLLPSSVTCMRTVGL